MAVWSTEAITEFIRLFRQHSCLWKVKTREYTNRHLKNEAYDDLVEYCKKLGFTSANRDFVSKKIQNLRGAFRKELKKVTDARKQGEINYRPTLWYYDLLYFTKDQDVEDDNNYNKEEESESSSSDQPSYSTYTPQATSDASPSLPPKISSPPIRDYMFAEESNERIAPRKVLKRKAIVTDTQIKLMKVCTEALKRKEMSEFDCFAVSVAKKLEKMNSIQALLAESIMHSVLKRGILNRLTEATDIYDKQCNKNIYLSPRPSSAASSDHAAAVYHGVQGGEIPTSENLYDNVFEESSGLKMEPE